MSRKTDLPRCLCRTEAGYRMLLPLTPVPLPRA